MSTTFINQATVKSVVSGITKTKLSNEVKATLFEDLEIVKSQAYELVCSGGTQTYTITVKNLNLLNVLGVIVSDNIPVGMSYITGSLKVNGVVTVPSITGQLISTPAINILGSQTISVTFDVLVA